MGIVSLNMADAEIAEEVWAIQHPAYRIEAALIGVADLPPLQDTVQSLQACEETFLGYRNTEEELIGVISYEQEQEGFYTLCRLMVNPEFTRRGIGRLLVERFLSLLPANSTASVTAEVRNLPAIALYERCGFVQADSFQPVLGITMLRLKCSVQ